MHFISYRILGSNSNLLKAPLVSLAVVIIGDGAAETLEGLRDLPGPGFRGEIVRETGRLVVKFPVVPCRCSIWHA